MRRRTAAGLLLAGSVALAAAAGADTNMQITPVDFSEIDGWSREDHAAALAVFASSCARIRGNDLVPSADWSAICAAAATAQDARGFFETFLTPVMIEDGKRALFTGYYEPEIIASRSRVGKFRYPLYRRPPEFTPGTRWRTRAEIESGLLSGRGLELAWLPDPVEAFFLHVQGSGRLRLNEGGVMRVGFDSKNGHPYRSIGKEMIRRGLIAKHRASAQRIKAWVRKNPVVGRDILNHNPSFIFFRELKGLAEDAGPPGAMQVSVSPRRSIAVDPRYIPLGAPVWIDMKGDDPMTRLMVAQDVGSAIKGAQRADIFFGSGPEAGKIAGRIKATGRLVTLIPKAALRRLLPEG